MFAPYDEGRAANKVAILAQKLKPHGRLFIHDFSKKEHGTPPAEIRALTSAAGLHESESRTIRPLIMVNSLTKRSISLKNERICVDRNVRGAAIVYVPFYDDVCDSL